MRKTVLEKVEGIWEHYITYEDGVFVTKSTKMIDTIWFNKFGFFDNPEKFFKEKYGWVIDRKKFDQVVRKHGHSIINYIHGVAGLDQKLYEFTINYLLKKDDILLSPDVLRTVYEKTVNSVSSGQIYSIIEKLENGESLSKILKDSDYRKIDSSEITAQVFHDHKDKLDDSNSEKIINWMIGQVMKETKGKACPKEVKDNLMELWSKL